MTNLVVGSGGGGFAFQGTAGDGVDNGPTTSHSNPGFCGNPSPQRTAGSAPPLNGGGGGGAGAGGPKTTAGAYASGGEGYTAPWIPVNYGQAQGTQQGTPGGSPGGYFAGGGVGGGGQEMPTTGFNTFAGAGRGGTSPQLVGNAAANSGSGGGGGSGQGNPQVGNNGGAGGSGVVLIRYAAPA